jgi:hypothetical protein
LGNNILWCTVYTYIWFFNKKKLFSTIRVTGKFLTDPSASWVLQALSWAFMISLSLSSIYIGSLFTILDIQQKSSVFQQVRLPWPDPLGTGFWLCFVCARGRLCARLSLKSSRHPCKTTRTACAPATMLRRRGWQWVPPFLCVGGLEWSSNLLKWWSACTLKAWFACGYNPCSFGVWKSNQCGIFELDFLFACTAILVLQ